jgi:hypothetical protein
VLKNFTAQMPTLLKTLQAFQLVGCHLWFLYLSDCLLILRHFPWGNSFSELDISRRFFPVSLCLN